jgi:hypothetical protein
MLEMLSLLIRITLLIMPYLGAVMNEVSLAVHVREDVMFVQV